MNEYITVLQSGIAMTMCGVCAGLYSLGGRSWKFWRRFVASLLFSATFLLIALWRQEFHYGLLVIIPGLILQYTMGYGGDDVTWRVRKRFLIVLVSLLLGGTLSIFLGVPIAKSMLILAMQLCVGIVSLIFAVKNPFEAAFEEAFVCMITTMPLMGYLFVV